MNKKNLSYAAIVIVLLIASFLFYNSSYYCDLFCAKTDNVAEQEQKVSQQFSLIVKIDNQEDKEYKLDLVEGQNGFVYLESLANSNQGFEFEYSTYDFGKFVTSINGVVADPSNSFWEFLVNDQQSAVGISDYIVKSGDVITFKITKFI